ncbi:MULTISPECIES: hypothetical protein [unclassified Bartonella]|uniref:hypothetical protein n=1 Tax=unclassified Bartonella TaxID=2645622 RepID=UPI0035CFD18D
MEKKYELTDEMDEVGGRTLYRIRALKDFGNVKKGDLGGFIEKEGNLSHGGDCWVGDYARVYDNARVYQNAHISGYAYVYGDARVYGDALVSDEAKVYNYAKIYGDADLRCEDWIGSNSRISTGAN